MKKDDERANNRPDRSGFTPLYKQSKLTLHDRPGYYRYYVNDVPGRVDAFKRAGWKVITEGNDETQQGFSQTETAIGTVTRRVVNFKPGAPCTHAVAMEIPIEWYLEDQEAQQKLLDEQEAQSDAIVRDSYGEIRNNIQRMNGTKL